MLSGDNSILKKAGEARDLTEVSQEKENISLAYNSALIDKMQKESNAITIDEFDKAIKSYDANATTSSEGSKIIVTFSNGHKYTLYKNGNIGEYSEPSLAKDKLTVIVNEDQSVTSPYYVNYPSSKGTIKCRVLYNDITYGLQLISVNPIVEVELGKNDSNKNVTGEMNSLERAINSYNRAITTLNEKSAEYIETSDGSILATDARCVGSNVINKNYPEYLTGDERAAEMFTADSTYTYMNEYNGKCFKTDTNYETDYNRLVKIGIKKITDANSSIKSYWLATHYISATSAVCNARLRCVSSTGNLNHMALFAISNVGKSAGSQKNGLRPVFTLSPNVKIIDGEGTEEVPFEIGL